VCIKGADGKFYYFGHLSEIKVKFGDSVKITDVIGIEGNTGHSTGSHCHYCARPNFASGNAFNISEISGIPNALGVYDDGYTTAVRKTVNVTLSADGKTYSGTLSEK
ncbi:MAG: M23 family metallopeptidase, partial [Ruminococcus sp.]|nr:M23 family metallopeptidase [Ruminococcus sp.]